MKLQGIIYCDVDGAEIPEGEETNEFDNPFVGKVGHCHSECLTQRNTILAEFNATFASLSAMLDPSIESASKIHRSVEMESRRGRQLKRVPRKEPKALKDRFYATDAQGMVRKRPSSRKAPRAIVAPPPPNAATLRRKVKKVKRGA